MERKRAVQLGRESKALTWMDAMMVAMKATESMSALKLEGRVRWYKLLDLSLVCR